jgi:hypothetical protein
MSLTGSLALSDLNDSKKRQKRQKVSISEMGFGFGLWFVVMPVVLIFKFFNYG